MRQVCARCGDAFEGWDALLLTWCKLDRFFVCPACWDRGCDAGHGRGNMGAALNTWEVLNFLLLAWLFLGILGPLAFADAARIQTWASLPTTPIGSIPLQGLVRIQGTVIDSDSIAWGGHEAWTRTRWIWDWSVFDAFGVRDASGEIAVTTNRWWAVEGTRHPAPTSERGVGSLYLPGDSILIVGEIAGAGANEHVEILYASPDAFRLDSGPPVGLGLAATAPFPPLAAAIVAEGLRRKRVHRRKVTPRNAPDNPLKRLLSGRARLARVAIASTAVGLAVITVIVLDVILATHTRAEFYKFGVVAGLILGVGGIFAGAAFGGRPSPN